MKPCHTASQFLNDHSPNYSSGLTEKLLQYIWQFQYFNNRKLFTTSGDPLEILSPGRLNNNQGPDFSDARVKIAGLIFAGAIELHLKTLQWEEHEHSKDPNYRNVVLHVVYEHNDPKPQLIPVLELQSLIPKILLERYAGLMTSPSRIPCSGSIATVDDLVWLAWKDRLLAERLTRKSKPIILDLESNKGHWEEIFWIQLARNFGMKVNSDAFEAMARSLPLKILAKHKNQIHQLEALVFGQSGLLNHKFRETYPKLLQREYYFLRKKYGLHPIHMPVHFLRMRPGNFPTIRLAELAALIQQSEYLFSGMLESESISSLKKQFEVTANDYWHYHYLFDELTRFRKKNLGKEMIDNLIINTIVPILFAFGLYRNEEKYQQKALKWLEETSAECNGIIREFAPLGIFPDHAFDSQALIELKTRYCNEKYCLQCAIGASILKTKEHDHFIASEEKALNHYSTQVSG